MVIVPLILPGVISGALLAFITSFDEVVVVLFVGSVEQRTIPWKMFSGIREEIRPTILAVATLLVVVSIILLTMVSSCGGGASGCAGFALKRHIAARRQMFL